MERDAVPSQEILTRRMAQEFLSAKPAAAVREAIRP
jgi:hypothetical protein